MPSILSPSLLRCIHNHTPPCCPETLGSSSGKLAVPSAREYLHTLPFLLKPCHFHQVTSSHVFNSSHQGETVLSSLSQCWNHPSICTSFFPRALMDKQPSPCPQSSPHLPLEALSSPTLGFSSTLSLSSVLVIPVTHSSPSSPISD